MFAAMMATPSISMLRSVSAAPSYGASATGFESHRFAGHLAD
jgi:hypothetical protein